MSNFPRGLPLENYNIIGNKVENAVHYQSDITLKLLLATINGLFSMQYRRMRRCTTVKAKLWKCLLRNSSLR